MNYSFWNLPENTNILSISQINLTDIEKAATLCFKRKDRFIEGSNYERDLIILLNKYFGNNNILFKTGLIIKYKSLKDYIIKNNLIGLILCGINNQTNIGTYYTNENKKINLTISSITRTLIYNYFNQNKVNEYCKLTPNFAVYYNNEN